MCAEEAKENGEKAAVGGCGCNPENFQEFFKMFREHPGGEGGFHQCLEMMKVCCGSAKKADKHD